MIRHIRLKDHVRQTSCTSFHLAEALFDIRFAYSSSHCLWLSCAYYSIFFRQMSSGKIVCEIYFALRYFLRGGFRGSVRVQLKYINKKSRPAAASLLLFCLAPKGMVETKRIELSTLRMRTVRSPSWATSPWKPVPEKDKSIIAHDSIFCSPIWFILLM